VPVAMETTLHFPINVGRHHGSDKKVLQAKIDSGVSFAKTRKIVQSEPAPQRGRSFAATAVQVVLALRDYSLAELTKRPSISQYI